MSKLRAGLRTPLAVAAVLSLIGLAAVAVRLGGARPPPPAATSPRASFEPVAESWVSELNGLTTRFRGDGLDVQSAGATHLRLGATRVLRGDVELSAGAVHVAREEDGQLRVQRGAVHERLEPKAHLEQSWRFDAAPAGSGALEVSIPVEGHFVREAADGLHFAAQPVGVVYGHATWVDASGARQAVPARWNGSAIVMRVPADTVERAAYPAVLDPIISAEFTVSTPQRIPLAEPQTNPEVAFNGTHVLVVWARDLAPAEQVQIDAQRLTPAGAAVDTMPLKLGTVAVSMPSTPRDVTVVAASNGSDFLVVWAAAPNVVGARVSSAGALLDATPFIIGSTTSATPATKPVVAWDGTQYLVVWQDSRLGSPRIFANRVSTAGATLDNARGDGRGFLVSSNAAEQLDPGVASSGTNTLVSWSDARTGTTTRHVYGVRLSSAGARLDAVDLAIGASPTSDLETSAAWNGANYLVTWRDSTAGPTQRVLAVRVSPGGAVQDSTPLVVSAGARASGAANIEPHATAVSGAFVVSWFDFSTTTGSSDVRAARLPSSGSTFDTSLLLSSGSQGARYPGIGSDGTNAWVVWNDDRDSAIFGNRLAAATGAVLDGAGVLRATRSAPERLPAIASDGTNYLVVWRTLNGINQPVGIYAMRVSAAGVPLDARALTLSTTGTGRPDVAWTGSSFAVVWTEPTGVVMKRVSSAGAVLDAMPFKVSTRSGPETAPAVASDGANGALVVVEEPANNGDIYATQLSNLSAASPTRVATVPIKATAASSRSPDVAFDAVVNAYVVTWLDNGTGSTQVSALLRGAAGTGSETPVSSGLTAVSGTPAISSCAGRFVVAWQVGTGVSTSFVNGAAGSTTLTVGATQAVSTTPTATDPAVVSDGATCLCAWTQSGTPSTTWGRRLSPSGTFFTAPFQVLASTRPHEFPALASAGLWRYLVATDETGATQGEATRIKAVTLSNSAPVANSVTLSTNEDTPRAVNLTASDADGEPLTFTVLMNPTRGTLTGTPPSLTYTPMANTFGPDTLTFKVNDGAADSTTATVTLNVVAVNDLPVPTPQTVSTNEDTPVSVTLSGTDVENSPLTFSVGAAVNGTVSGTPPTVTFTPAANFNGVASFTFSANDGTGTSLSPATITINVAAVNDAPVATSQSVNATEDTPVAVTLSGTDAENSPLTFQLVAMPTKGTFTGTAPNLTYVPSLNSNGVDTFTFTVRDGALTSAAATVTLNVAAVNDPPVAQGQTVSTAEDTPLALVLAGSDADLDTLDYFIQGNPSHGTLNGTAPTVTYTPTANYSGPDTFTFYVRDRPANASSTPVTVTVNVTAVNDAPTATPQTLSTPEDTPLVVVLSGVDVEGSPLTYTVLTQPANGTLTGTAPNLLYTPATNYHGGPDTLTFKVSDGTLDSTVATVTFNVTPVNDAPLAQSQARQTQLDTPLNLTLTGTDVEGSPLTFTVVTMPSNGTLTGSGASRVYTPNTGYRGTDSFTFRVNDGQLDSSAVQVTIAVGSLNSAPVATSQMVMTPEDTPLNITLTGTDPDGNTLSFALLTQPSGTLTGTPPNLTYTPRPNVSGSDAFTFKANDGTVDSAAATVTIVVTPVNDVPVAHAQSVATVEDTPLTITLTGTDVETAALTYTIRTQPLQGTLSGTPPQVTYTPSPNANGLFSFTFEANDGQAASPPATVTVNVTPVNDAPVATAQRLSLTQGGTLAIVLTATDVDSTALTYSLVTQPSHGTLTGTPPNVTYQAAAGYRGADAFTFKASDLQQDSAPATVELTIAAVNQAPVVQAQTVPTLEDTPTNISVTGFDSDGDQLTWTIVSSPSHGTLDVNGSAPNYTYVPRQDFNGSDTFTIKANDGTSDSQPANINLTVAAVNDRPVVDALSVTLEQDKAVEVTLRGVDVDRNDVLTFTVRTPPQHGALTGEAPQLTYTPTRGYTGTDSFTYVANDGTVDSIAKSVELTVTPIGGQQPRKDTVQLNGWSCGCGQGGGGFGGFLLLAAGLVRLARRRRTRGAVTVLALLSVLVTASVAQAKPAAKKPAAPPPAAAVTPAPAPVAPVSPPAPSATLTATPQPAAAPVTPAVKPGRPSVAVIDVNVTVPNEKLDGAAFTEMMVVAADQSALFKVISAQELRTMLGVERQKQLLGCAEDSCLTELAEALGTDFVLDGSVGRVGASYLATVRLIDSRSSRVVGRGSTQVTDANLLLNAMWRSTQDAFDAAAATRPADEAQVWLARPRKEPVAATPPPTSQLGVAVSALGGVQPLAAEGSRVTVGAEVDVSWRIARFDLGAGVVVSPVVGIRLFAGYALLSVGPSRLSVLLRGSGFPGSGVYGGGVGASYEFALHKHFGLQAGVAADLYSGGAPVILALLGALGAVAHF